RCRYCGRVSNFGWAQMVCDRCEKMRAQIETGAMSQFSIADRRGWRGHQTIGDDELLLAIQRRLRDADHRALETGEREKRHADRARRWAKDEPELEAAECPRLRVPPNWMPLCGRGAAHGLNAARAQSCKDAGPHVRRSPRQSNA